MTADDTGRPTRRFAIAVWVAILVPLLTGVVVVAYARSASSTTEGLKRTIDVALCTAAYGSEVSAAEVVEDRARETRERAFADGLVAAVRGDEAATTDAADRIEAASEDISAAIEARSAAIKRRDAALVLATKDPVAFLDECDALTS